MNNISTQETHTLYDINVVGKPDYADTDSRMPTALIGDCHAYYATNFVKRVELHHHDFYELYMTTSKNVNYYIEGTLYRLKPNNILLISPNEIHMSDIPQNQQYERYVLWLSTKIVKSLSTPLTDLSVIFRKSARSKERILVFPDDKCELIKALIIQIKQNIEKNSYGQDIICRSNIEQVLLLLNGINEDKMTSVKVNNVHIDAILLYINKNLNAALSIESLSERFCLSKSTITHLFKQYVGTSIHKYILEKRLVYAKQLIAQGWSIAEVCIAAGFPDYSVFFRTFKNHYGITPKGYYDKTRE